MSDVIATVVIETDGGPVVINKSDFDAETMEIFEGELPPTLDDVLGEIDGMKKPELIEALTAFEADTDGNVDALKERLSALATEKFNAGELV